MAKQALITAAEKDFDAISLYYRSGDVATMTPEQKRILDRWRSAYEILRQFPSKHVAVKKLILAFPGLSRTQAFADINNAIRFWNKQNPIDRDFVEAWFVDILMTEIAEEREKIEEAEFDDKGNVKMSGPNRAAIAKNLATLQKYIQTLPPVKIDPKHMEKNNIYIQFNVNGNLVNFTEEELQRLPVSVRQRFLESIPNEITDVEAIEMINS